MVLRPAATRKSRKLLEMQTLGLHPRPIESHVLRWVPEICVLTSPSGDIDESSRLRTPGPGQYPPFTKEEAETQEVM